MPPKPPRPNRQLLKRRNNSFNKLIIRSMNDIKAQLNSLRIAPRKVRALTNLIKDKDVESALDQLSFYVRRGSPAIIKLIKSAIANAENNFKLDRAALFIKSISVDEGIKLKRYRPKGFGRAAPIEKKTSRVKLVLGSRPKQEGKKNSGDKKPESSDSNPSNSNLVTN